MLAWCHLHSATQAPAGISPAYFTKATCLLASPLLRPGTLAAGFSWGAAQALCLHQLFPLPGAHPCLCMAGSSCNVLSWGGSPWLPITKWPADSSPLFPLLCGGSLSSSQLRRCVSGWCLCLLMDVLSAPI